MSTTVTTADARRERNAPAAARLRRIRYDRGLTVAQVAAELDVAERTVYAWEQGHARPEPATYSRLRTLLDTEDGLWFGEEGPR
ncbi:helix-turn-helix transcriptional regulator [Nocardiopsis ganjiahuensis]|uniref:helix-turn-helix transcriptional regulator n=1 Tax=Nocardiopsis ganjiahuensis TaxID=239984 RepID=UPI0003473C7D|nr:helix-turn-helix transcriptional regulator [Nocardiopsis ganjiahuensis]